MTTIVLGYSNLTFVMIRYLEHSQIDRQKWDDLMAAHGPIYAYSWYLDVVHPNWEVLVLDDYDAVMPITGGKKFGVHYLFQPFFVQQLGIVSKFPLSPEIQTSFLQAIPEKYRFCEIRLNENNTFVGNIQGVDGHRNVVLDLNRPYETIRANYHTNTKRNLTKAESNGLELTDGTELKEIITLFRENRGLRVKAWGEEEYVTLTQLYEAARHNHHAFIVGVKRRETKELLCGGLFMTTPHRVVFLFSGCSEQGKQLQAMSLMMDGVIQRYVGQTVLFDFEGSDDDNLARFYLGFGGEERSYPAYSFNRLSVIGKGLLKFWKRLK